MGLDKHWRWGQRGRWQLQSCPDLASVVENDDEEFGCVCAEWSRLRDGRQQDRQLRRQWRRQMLATAQGESVS